ncbi:hypothetical protein G7Y89_g3209 [Cudoniella acicularis]|uniref:Uncharacterized protein n=1 Tax=Cudoniella acicularis TaxID=354080 RepID=A0A8H4RUT7_9HELO|nr:hypothetical protein G7Y89_g3209 [Cudoniella acicularis]
MARDVNLPDLIIPYLVIKALESQKSIRKAHQTAESSGDFLKTKYFLNKKMNTQLHPSSSENKAFLRTFTSRVHTICLFILTHFEKHLSLKQGSLTKLHRLSALSADQIRLLKMAAQSPADQGTSLLAHTDFGSVMLLWNVLDGL